MLLLPALLNIVSATYYDLLVHHLIVAANLLLDFEDPDFHANMKNHGRDIKVKAKGYGKKWKKLKIWI